MQINWLTGNRRKCDCYLLRGKGWREQEKMPNSEDENSKPLSTLDRITLTPYVQYKKYGIIPYSIIFHIILLLLTTSFLLINSHQQNAEF